MKKYLILPVLLILMGCFQFVYAESDPVNMLQSVASQMISGLKSHKSTLKTNPSVVYSLSYNIVVPHADLDAMSKHVLPPQTWNSASAAQKEEFKKLFTTILVRTYSSALAQYTDETIKFFPVRGNGQRLTVNSKIIRNDGPPIAVSYQVINTGGSWKLIDMSVEGISMLESFRSQFADKLSSGNMNTLLAALKQHNAARMSR